MGLFCGHARSVLAKESSYAGNAVDTSGDPAQRSGLATRFLIGDSTGVFNGANQRSDCAGDCGQQLRSVPGYSIGAPTGRRR